jgi:plasmid stabilization system protein ParE
MTATGTHTEDDEDAAEAQALAAAIAESDADPRSAPHDEVRAWLLRIANGDFDAPPPEPRRTVPVVWRAKALADVSRIVRYIATDNAVAARVTHPPTSPDNSSGR